MSQPESFNHKYKSFFENSTDAMLIIENGLFVDCNGATVKMLRYDSKEEFLDKPPSELSPEFQPDGTKSSEKAEKMMTLAFEKGAICFEWVHIRKNGKSFPVEVSLTAIPSNNGTRTLHTVWRDISRRKKAEAELIRMQKLKSLGTLAGGIAHDFNNIFLGVYGNISLAKEELNEDSPAYSFIEDAEKSINRATSLSNQLLTFARCGVPVRKPENIGKLVRDVTQFSLAGSNIIPLIKEADELWSADVDKGQIEQVISNLLVNAKHAMPVGGNVFIILDNADLSDESSLSIANGKYVRITVRDEGIGIETANLERIFDPYFTTKQTGNGLGLATSHSIIDKHDGYIRVTSALGKGTTFSVYLPACDSMQPPELPVVEAEKEVSHNNARVLIVDDEDYVRNITRLMLERKGYSVETAIDGKDAIEMYKDATELGNPFDLLLLDLTIPGGMGGTDTIRHLINLDPEVKAIVFSGYSDNPVMAEYEQYGFCGRLTKPFRTKELAEEVFLGIGAPLGDRRRLGLRHSPSGAMTNCPAFLRSHKLRSSKCQEQQHVIF